MSRTYGRRGWVDRRRPRVLDVAPGLIHESGPERGRDWSPDRVAVMAHWSTSAEPSRSVVAMLRELDAAGFETVLVSAAEFPGPIGRVCAWAPGRASDARWDHGSAPRECWVRLRVLGLRAGVVARGDGGLARAAGERQPDRPVCAIEPRS